MNSESASILGNILDTFNLIGDELNDPHLIQELDCIEKQISQESEKENQGIIVELEKTLSKAPQTYAYVLSDRIRPLILERIRKIKKFYRTRSGVVQSVSAAGKAAYVSIRIANGIKQGVTSVAQGRCGLILASMKQVAQKTAVKILTSKSTWIAAAAFATVQIGFSYYDFKKGNIDWKQFKRSLKYIAGETVASVGGGAVCSSIGAAIGMAFGPMGGLIGGIIGGVVGGVTGAAAVSSLRTPNSKDIIELETEKRTEIGNQIYLNCLQIVNSSDDDSLEVINSKKKKLLLAHHPDKNRDKSESIQEACRLECIKVLQAYELIKQHRRTEDENEIKK